MPLCQAADNEKLREQLQSFMKQYELRDKHFEHQIQEKELEKRLAEAKHAQVPHAPAKGAISRLLDTLACVRGGGV